MPVRMAALLTLVILLMIHRVCGQCWYVNYTPSPYICALRGSTVSTTCFYPTGYQIEEVFWTTSKNAKLSGPEISQWDCSSGNQENSYCLHISEVTQEDSDNYYCTFVSSWDNIFSATQGVRLSVTDLQVESPERVTEGDSVRLTCRSSCKLIDTPIFIWYRNSKPLTQGSIQNKLVYSSVSRGHAGGYSCGVQGQDYISPTVYLNVRYKPWSVLVSISESDVITEGDSVTLSCSSDSNPPAALLWYKGVEYIKSGRIFSILMIKSDDSGEYKCRAINEHGEKYSDPVTLDVQYPPRSVSVSISGSAVIMSGDSVSLMCISDSNPPALSFSWFEENQSSAVGSGQSFSAVQSGRFYCEAHNPHGAQRSDAVTVTVQQGMYLVFVIAAASGGLFIIIIIIIIIIVLIVQRKRIRQRSAVHQYENNCPGINRYAALDPNSRSPDQYNMLSAVHPRPALHQSGRSEYENLSRSG
nr:B-cell receptor CD22-like [Danio rerio]|eukprot:XP_021333851.1 B-cell receptor CD22-like [Danio rerio]